MNMARVAVLSAFVLVPCTAAAGPDPRQDLVDGMAKCAAVPDNTARLACYDALNPTLHAAQAAPPPAPPPAAAPPATAAADSRPWYDIFGVSPSHQVTPEQFGGEGLQAPAPPPGTPAAAASPPPALDSITATVTDYSFNPYDKFVVFLDNGQIWKQLSSDTGGKARFQKGEKNTVVISRGFVGSYNMTINDGPVFKVTRVK